MIHIDVVKKIMGFPVTHFPKLNPLNDRGSQVQGLHGLEHYELVNIGALQSSCELSGAPDPNS
jgi:hypothetical protein